MIEAPKPELYDLDAGPRRDAEPRRAARTRASPSCSEKLQAALARPAPTPRRPSSTPRRPSGCARSATSAGAAAARGRGRDARATRRTACRSCPASTRGMMVGAHRARDRDPRADARCSREDPGLLVARRSLAMAYGSAGQYDARRRRAAPAREGDGLSRRGRGRARRQPALRRAASTRRRRCSRRRRARTRASRSRGSRSPRCTSRRGKLAEAAAAYEHVLEIAPDHVEALRGLGDLAFVEQDADAAGAPLRPDPRGRARRRGRALEARRRAHAHRTRRRRRSRSSAARSRREPKNGEALLYLAGALASTGRAAEALPFFERALDAGQRNPMALNGLALTRMALGDRPGRRGRVPRVAAPRPEAAGGGAGAGPAAIAGLAGPAPRSRTARAPRPSGRPARSVTTTIAS